MCRPIDHTHADHIGRLKTLDEAGTQATTNKTNTPRQAKDHDKSVPMPLSHTSCRTTTRSIPQHTGYAKTQRSQHTGYTQAKTQRSLHTGFPINTTQARPAKTTSYTRRTPHRVSQMSDNNPSNSVSKSLVKPIKSKQHFWYYLLEVEALTNSIRPPTWVSTPRNLTNFASSVMQYKG